PQKKTRGEAAVDGRETVRERKTKMPGMERLQQNDAPGSPSGETRGEQFACKKQKDCRKKSGERSCPVKNLKTSAEQPEENRINVRRKRREIGRASCRERVESA